MNLLSFLRSKEAQSVKRSITRKLFSQPHVAIQLLFPSTNPLAFVENLNKRAYSTTGAIWASKRVDH